MERILERYERYSYAERQLLANDDPENQVCHLSVIKLLKWTHRQTMHDHPYHIYILLINYILK